MQNAFKSLNSPDYPKLCLIRIISSENGKGQAKLDHCGEGHQLRKSILLCNVRFYLIKPPNKLVKALNAAELELLEIEN